GSQLSHIQSPSHQQHTCVLSNDVPHLPSLQSSPTRRSSDLERLDGARPAAIRVQAAELEAARIDGKALDAIRALAGARIASSALDRKSTRLNSSHGSSSYAVLCLKKKKSKLYAKT